MSNDDTKVIIEHFDNQFSKLIESVEAIVDRKVQPIADDMTDVKTDIKIMKAALTETNQDLRQLEKAVKETNADLKTLDKTVGKLEHRIDMLYKLGLIDSDTFHALKVRVDNLEAAV